MKVYDCVYNDELCGKDGFVNSLITQHSSDLGDGFLTGVAFPSSKKGYWHIVSVSSRRAAMVLIMMLRGSYFLIRNCPVYKKPNRLISTEELYDLRKLQTI